MILNLFQRYLAKTVSSAGCIYYSCNAEAPEDSGGKLWAVITKNTPQEQLVTFDGRGEIILVCFLSFFFCLLLASLLRQPPITLALHRPSAMANLLFWTSGLLLGASVWSKSAQLALARGSPFAPFQRTLAFAIHLRWGLLWLTQPSRNHLYPLTPSY